MKLLVASVTYREVSLAELERLSLPREALARLLPEMVGSDVLEAVALSTCNRTEVYAWARDEAAAERRVLGWLEAAGGFPLAGRCRVLRGEEAIRHLFLVATGLDSMVQGESEIQGQVRRAYRWAAELGAVGPHLHRLFRWALEAGKRARREVGLARAAHSLPGAAAAAIAASLGDLRDREVLVVGSGKVAASFVRGLGGRGARIHVAARRPEAAASLAAGCGGTGVPLAALADVLSRVEGAVFATAAPRPLVDVALMRSVLRARNGSRLVVVDLGVPRNVDPAVSTLADEENGFVLYDLERLDREGFTGPGGLEASLAGARAIVLEEVARCVAHFRARPAEAVAAAIQELADRVATAEVDRAARRVAGLDERQRAAVEAAIRRGIRRIVHLPTVRAKEACSQGDLEVLEAARWLFALEGEETLDQPRAGQAETRVEEADG